MTTLDETRPHVVTAPYEFSPGRWWGACTCGSEFFGDTSDEVRRSGVPHRDVGRSRVGALDRGRDEERRLRREARREQRRSKVEDGRPGMRK